MKGAIALPLELIRREPGLLARFAVASIGRAALTAASILLIREFLSSALDQSGAFWSMVALLFVALIGSSLLMVRFEVTMACIRAMDRRSKTRSFTSSTLNGSNGWWTSGKPAGTRIARSGLTTR